MFYLLYCFCLFKYILVPPGDYCREPEQSARKFLVTQKFWVLTRGQRRKLPNRLCSLWWSSINLPNKFRMVNAGCLPQPGIDCPQ